MNDCSSISNVSENGEDMVSSLVAWKPPRSGSSRLNVDGSSLGNPGQAGIGGLLIRDAEKCRVGFFDFLGFMTNTQAELIVIKRGLEVAGSMAFVSWSVNQILWKQIE